MRGPQESAEMNTEETSKALVRKTHEGVLGFLIKLVLSVGLIGGSSYLLFQADKDQEEIDESVLLALEEAREGHAGVEIAKIFYRS